MQKLLILSLILLLIPDHHARPMEDTLGTIHIPLESYYNSIFVSSITLDVNKDIQLRVMLDTSTSDFWVPSVACTSNWCENHRLFNSTLSQSYINKHRNFSTIYLEKADISGGVGSDKLIIGDAALERVEFGEALTIGQIDDFTNMFDGVMGLGVSSKVSTGTPVVQAMLAAGLLDDAVYSFVIDKTTKSTPEQVGQLVIGSVQHHRYSGDMAWGPVQDEDSWITSFDSVMMGDDVLSEGINVECSTSNPLIVGPHSQVQKIYDILEAKEIPAVCIRTVDCDKVDSFPALKFLLNGVKVEIGADDYVTKASFGQGYEYCYLGITSYEDSQDDRWVLGALAHTPIYIVYNFGIKSLGFAQSADNSYS